MFKLRKQLTKQWKVWKQTKSFSTTTEVKTPAVPKVVKKGTKPVEGTTVETREEVIPFATKQKMMTL